MSRNAPQLPNTVLAQNAVTVPTSTGFNAGDLVYYKGSNGDYASPSNLDSPSGVAFPYSPASSIYGGTVGTPFSAVFDTTTGTYGGSRYKFAAVLTNGNIVQVWNNYADNNPYFRVVDTSGTVVVSPTSVSATYLVSSSNNPIGVAALAGGGFVVYWVNASGGTANKPCYAVYSNTGSVVTAAVNDTSLAAADASTAAIAGVALSGGGFALVMSNSTNTSNYYRGYSATGVGAYSWSTSFAPNSYLNAAGLAARSDGSFVLFNYTNTNYGYSVISSAGSLLVNTSFSFTTGKNFLDATVLSDGMTVVFAYTNTASGYMTPCFRLLPASNTLSAEFTVPNANMNFAGALVPNFNAVFGLSTGNFIFMFCDSAQQAQYVVYNSSGVAQSGTNTAGALPKQVPGMFVYSYTRPVFIEVGSNIQFYWQPAAYNKKSYNMYTASINKNTFELVLPLTTTQTADTFTAPVGSANIGTATANSVSYYAGATGTATVTSAMRYLVQPTALSSNQASSTAITTLSDGRIAMAYVQFSTATVYIAIFSAAGVLQQTVNGGTVFVTGGLPTGGQAESMRIGATTNGGFAVTYYSTVSQIRVRLFSSTGVLTGTYVSPYNPAGQAQGNTLPVCGLTDGNLVFGYLTGSNTFRIEVINVTTAVQIWTVEISTATRNPNLVADKFGGFAAYHFNGTNTIITIYYKQTSSSYAVSGNTTISGSATGGATSGCLTYLPGSGYYMTAFGASTSCSVYGYNQTPDLIGNFVASNSFTLLSDNAALGTTGDGGLVAFFSGTLMALNPGGAYTSSTWPSFSFPSTNTFALTNYTRAASSSPGVTAGFGDCVALCWLDSGYLPRFALVQGVPSQNLVGYTSGVTVSQPANIVPYTSTTPTTSVTNTVLSGVAVTTATAGGTGLVQTNGLAQLNSSYPSGTVQNFDFQSPNGTAVSGVKGSISGRNVTLQGTN